MLCCFRPLFCNCIRHNEQTSMANHQAGCLRHVCWQRQQLQLKKVSSGKVQVETSLKLLEGELSTFGDIPFWMKHPLIFSQALKLSALAGQAARVVQASVLKGLTTWTISTEDWHRLAPVNSSMDHTSPHHWSRKWHCDCSQAGGSWYSSWC